MLALLGHLATPPTADHSGDLSELFRACERDEHGHIVAAPVASHCNLRFAIADIRIVAYFCCIFVPLAMITMMGVNDYLVIIFFGLNTKG